MERYGLAWIRDALEAAPDPLPQIGAHPAPAMAHAAAVLVARAAAATSAAAVERTVVPEAVAGTIDGLSSRWHPARYGGVVQALAGVPAGAAEADLSMVSLGRAGALQREHGGGCQRRRLENLAARRVSRESTDDGIKAIRIHNCPPFGLSRPPGAVRHPSLMPAPDVKSVVMVGVSLP
jgi:hypothetical protein